MRRRVKLIVPLALAIVVAVVAVSMAAGDDKPQARDEPGESKFHRFGGTADPEVKAVLRRLKDAAAKQAPAIAGPVIARAENARRITAAQADELRNAAQELADGKSPRELAGTVDLRDWDVRAVIRDAFEALAQRAPAIAEPILDEAVQEGQITSSQADQIRDKIAMGRRFGAGRGHGRCHKRDRNRDVEREVRLDTSV